MPLRGWRHTGEVLRHHVLEPHPFVTEASMRCRGREFLDPWLEVEPARSTLVAHTPADAHLLAGDQERNAVHQRERAPASSVGQLLSPAAEERAAPSEGDAAHGAQQVAHLDLQGLKRLLRRLRLPELIPFRQERAPGRRLSPLFSARPPLPRE